MNKIYEMGTYKLRHTHHNMPIAAILAKRGCSFSMEEQIQQENSTLNVKLTRCFPSNFSEPQAKHVQYMSGISPRNAGQQSLNNLSQAINVGIFNFELKPFSLFIKRSTSCFLKPGKNILVTLVAKENQNFTL